MRIRYRRAVTKLGPIRINRAGPRITSVTMHFGPLLTLELWKRPSR
jgi:hypothetical protein